MNENHTPVIDVNDISYTWPGAEQPVVAINELTLKRQEKVFLHGASGSGKSTLLNLIAAVIKPQSGQIKVNDIELSALSGSKADQFRADNIGLVFQQFNLLPFLSVSENVQLPCRFSSVRKANATATAGGHSLQHEAERLLSAMKIPTELINQRSAMQLSVGQQQRVAVARALMGRPSLIIADEPTSSLDADSREAFLELLFSEVNSSGASLLFVSHDSALQTFFDRTITMDGINHITPTKRQA